MFDISKFQGIQWVLVPVFMLGRYMLPAGIIHYIFYVRGKRSLYNRKIQPAFPRSKDYRREFVSSAVTSLIFSVFAKDHDPFHRQLEFQPFHSLCIIQQTLYFTFIPLHR